MPDNLMLLMALLSNVVGMGWLALAMEVHWKQVRGRTPRGNSTVLGLRALGALALTVSLVLCLKVDHPSMAALVWVMALAGAALVIAFTLAWRAQWLAILLARRPARARV
ncbi:DUF3325 domain-containing protein [Alloalcanivorax mobilis]|uniref:DUF3325 domain-containing protein n=1 Tax=Alloalcanivorax mobilis TaxID=2019569 RepID=UPI0018E48DB9|nr:DUF3325 domain-containing protein [Alloalcanivorax mobilis]|tara:strand:- start:47357 stop:47686 length:330 start_codon:yes stop_codon:yes gene_type:complete